MVAWAVQAAVRAVGAGRAGLVAQRGGEARGAGTDPTQGIAGGPVVAVTVVLAVLAPQTLITRCASENTAVSQGPVPVTSLSSSPSPPASQAHLQPIPSPLPSPAPSIPIAVPIPSPTLTPPSSPLIPFPFPVHPQDISLQHPYHCPHPLPNSNPIPISSHSLFTPRTSHRRPPRNLTAPLHPPNPGVPLSPPHSPLEQSCPLQPGSHWQRSGATHRPWTHSWVQRAAGTQLEGEQWTAQDPPSPPTDPTHGRRRPCSHSSPGSTGSAGGSRCAPPVGTPCGTRPCAKNRAVRVRWGRTPLCELPPQSWGATQWVSPH